MWYVSIYLVIGINDNDIAIDKDLFFTCMMHYASTFSLELWNEFILNVLMCEHNGNILSLVDVYTHNTLNPRSG